MSVYQNTPTLTASDPRGLTVRTVAWNRNSAQETAQANITLERYNAFG